MCFRSDHAVLQAVVVELHPTIGSLKRNGTKIFLICHAAIDINRFHQFFISDSACYKLRYFPTFFIEIGAKSKIFPAGKASLNALHY